MTRIMTGFALALILIAGYARAQDAPQAGNPHGDIQLECTLCHGGGSWDFDQETSNFDHAEHGFELEGAHSRVHCRECHLEPRFSFVGTSCADCHADIHAGAQGADCAVCHDPRSWVARDEQRQAHDATDFPLVGAHSRVDCDACHDGGLGSSYVGTPTDCFVCHAENYEGTDSPNHREAGFETDCHLCHSSFASTWGSGDFIHSAVFPLTGGHRGLDCSACHTDGFTSQSSECYACHQPDYESTANPDHVAAVLPLACENCHSSSAWTPALFDHNSTGFALNGAHRDQDCLACHQTGYSGISSDCYACHQSDYESATDPSHVAANFPLECAACHTESAWTPATFDHGSTGWPLTGAHRDQECLACHQSGYQGTPTDCAACHQSDYDATTDPGHLAAGFSTDCAPCHTTQAWIPSTWDHDTIFPIYTGKHREEWSSCTDCHTVPANYSLFECIFCHKHNRADTDDKHNEVQDYQYLSAACLDCHPDGRE